MIYLWPIKSGNLSNLTTPFENVIKLMCYMGKFFKYIVKYTI